MSDLSQYVTLGVADEILAAPVERVQEILESRPIAGLPYAPPYLLGMIDVRGKGVPVIDLRAKLGLPQIADTENTRIIVLSVTIGSGEVTLGLKADRVFEVTILDAAALEPAPEIGARWRSEFIAGIGRRNGAFVTVLDLNHLFATGEATTLGSISGVGQAA
jgi:purine-binding chemotaxis protein CheW